MARQTNKTNKQNKQTNKTNKQNLTVSQHLRCSIFAKFFFRDDWEEVNETLFSQKQGKHIRDQKETTIARVKNLRNYMEKIANSKKEKLQHLKDGEELEVCLDLDAGGGSWKSGRRVWFLNENSETLKIHPFLLFEGHDVRNNLEISLGGLTNALNFLYQK